MRFGRIGKKLVYSQRHKPRSRSQRILRIEACEDRLPLAMDPDVLAIQLASIADRVIDSVGNDAFKTATSIPAISPVLDQALPTDLVVTYSGLRDPNAPTTTAVVLKPRSASTIYEIPAPAANDDHHEFLQQHLDQAASEGVGTILFPESFSFQLEPPIPFAQQPGGALSQEAHLNIRHMQDVVIDLNGSTLQFLDKVVGVRIEQSQRVLLKNGILRGEGLLSTVATVVADSSPAGIKLDVLPEFEADLEAEWSNLPPLRTVGSAELGPDDRWRLDAEGYAELFTNRGQPHNNFVYDNGEYIATSHLVNGVNPFEIGQEVWLLHESNNDHGLYLDNTRGSGIEDITLENLTFENIPGMVIVGELDRGLHVNRVRVAVAEEADGIWGASSDAIHINANGGDVVVENSDLGPNGDDKITIKGNYWRVTSLNRTTGTMTVQPVDNGVSMSRWGRAGDQVVFINNTFGVIAQATLTEDSSRPTAEGSTHTLKLSSIPAAIQVNALIGNVDQSGGRIVIRGNHFHETRAQAILVQSSHVVIEDNQFEGMGGPAISVELALEDWFEAINTNNILIRNNQFSRTSQSVGKTNELIAFYQVDRQGDPVDIIDHVIISGNTLDVPPTIDTTPPAVLAIQRVDANPTNSASVGFRVIFSEPVNGVEIDDFAIDASNLQGTSITSLSGSGDTYLVQVNTGSGDGTLKVNLVEKPTGTVSDASGNWLTASFQNGEVYSVQKTPQADLPLVELVYLNKSPTVSTTTIETQLELTNVDSERLNYKDMEIRYYFDADNLTPVFTVLSANAPASAYRISYHSTGKYVSIQFLQNYLVNVGDRFKIRYRITNTSGQRFDQSNDASFDPTKTAKGPSAAIHVFLTGQQIWGTPIGPPPTPVPQVLSILRQGPNPTDADLVQFIVTFSEPVTGVDLEDFVIDSSGLTGAAILDVDGSGASYLVSTETGTGSGSLGINFDHDRSGGVTNSEGQLSDTDFYAGEVYTITRLVDPPPPPTTDVELIYLNKTPRVMASSIEIQLELYNRETTSLNYKEMEIRYYFDADGLIPQFSLLSSNISGSNLSFHYEEGAKYISIRVLNDFMVSAADRWKFRFRVTNGTQTAFNQANDPSFDPTYTDRAPSEAIDVYLASEKIWG